MTTKLKTKESIILYHVLDGELRMVKVIGSLEIHGVNIGENLVSLEWLWVITNWELKVQELGLHLDHGLNIISLAEKMELDV